MFAVEGYLRRIGINHPLGGPTLAVLKELQLAHLMHVPFENLHAFHRRGVRTDIEWSYPKIVEQRRGGWCFELNGCFGELLRRIGFAVDYVSCQVWEAEPKEWGPTNDHLALIVHLEDQRWFVDVGFGDCCIHPLRVMDGETPAVPRRARIDLDDDGFTLTELMPDPDGVSAWEPQLRVGFEPKEMPMFDTRSTYLQTEPGLSWTEKAFATRALDADGSRVTLRMDVLRQREGTSAFRDTPVTPEEWSELLLRHFSLVDDKAR
ncbi:MAG: arylamine N-acetyltransferase [Ilumatobacteraceae bacterium]